MAERNNVTILGAGPAGISAAIYLKRAGFHPLVFEKQKPGGLLKHAHLVENYPGFSYGITGLRLAERFVKHFHKMGVTTIPSEVHHVDYKNDAFIIRTEMETYLSTAIIIATGTHPKKIRINGASSLEGTQLFYEPYAIPHQVNTIKKRILVIGGGDIAFDYTLTLLDWGHKVTILCRSEPSCLPLLQKQALRKGAVFYSKCIAQKVQRNRKELFLQCRQGDQNMELSTDFILIACGRNPNISFLSPSLKKHFDDHANAGKTSLPGLCFAGDVMRGTYRQTAIAVGDGIFAAMMMQRYLKEKGDAS